MIIYNFCIFNLKKARFHDKIVTLKELLIIEEKRKMLYFFKLRNISQNL